MKKTLGEIEDEYNISFGRERDMTLQEYFEDEGLPSLAKALEQIEKDDGHELK